MKKIRTPKWHSIKDKYGQYDQTTHLVELVFFLADWDELSEIQIRAKLECGIEAWLKYYAVI